RLLLKPGPVRSGTAVVRARRYRPEGKQRHVIAMGLEMISARVLKSRLLPRLCHERRDPVGRDDHTGIMLTATTRERCRASMTRGKVDRRSRCGTPRAGTCHIERWLH